MKRFLFFILFSSVSFYSLAQSSYAFAYIKTSKATDDRKDSVSAVRINKAYIKSYWSDGKGIATAPFHWSGKQWLTTAAVLGTGAIIYSQDMQIHDIFQKNRNKTTDDIAKYGLEPWGSGKYSISTMGLFYLYGAVAKNDRCKKVAMLGVKTYLITGFITGVVKETLHRHRPYQVEAEAAANGSKASPYIWDGPVSDLKYTSFPSGHTMSAFAMATIVASEYKDQPWVGVVSYTLAGLTALRFLARKNS